MARKAAPGPDVEVYRGIVEGTADVRTFNPETRRYEVTGSTHRRNVFGPYSTPGAARRVASGQRWGLRDVVVTVEVGRTTWEPHGAPSS